MKMKMKSIVLSMCAVAVMATMVVSATGTNTEDQQVQNLEQYASAVDIKDGKMYKNFSEFTEEEKQEMDARHKAMEDSNTAWNNLASNQKDEVYSILENMTSMEIQMIEKYLELGVISEDSAAEMKSGILEKIANIRQSGDMPMVGKGKKGRMKAVTKVDGEAIMAE